MLDECALARSGAVREHRLYAQRPNGRCRGASAFWYRDAPQRDQIINARNSAATHPATAPEKANDKPRDKPAEKSAGAVTTISEPIATRAPSVAPSKDHLQTI